MGRISTGDGFSIGYAKVGGGAPTPIVFLHGVGSDKSVWQRQLAHFGRERRALAFDYPGYGDSDPAFEETTREDYACAVLGALQELNIKQAHICGLSLGGVVAIAMYAQAPQLCASLIIADSFAVHPDGRNIYERSLAGSRDMRGMAESRVDFLLAQPADRDVISEVVETMSRIDPAAYRVGASAVWLADQRERASKITAPTLILCGEEDRATPLLLSRELHGMIPGSRLEIIAVAGHLANIEQPARFNELVDAFIRRVDGPS